MLEPSSYHSIIDRHINMTKVAFQEELEVVPWDDLYIDEKIKVPRAPDSVWIMTGNYVEILWSTKRVRAFNEGERVEGAF